MNQLTVERAVLQVLSGRALSPEECEAFSSDDLIEIARRLSDEGKRSRGVEAKP